MDAQTLTIALHGRWHGRYGAAPCSACQPEGRRDQDALTLSDGAALLSGRTVGHNDEIAEAQGWRLAAIIWRLKKRYGRPISTEYVGPENRASYKLQPSADRKGFLELTRLETKPIPLKRSER